MCLCAAWERDRRLHKRKLVPTAPRASSSSVCARITHTHAQLSPIAASPRAPPRVRAENPARYKAPGMDARALDVDGRS